MRNRPPLCALIPLAALMGLLCACLCAYPEHHHHNANHDRNGGARDSTQDNLYLRQQLFGQTAESSVAKPISDPFGPSVTVYEVTHYTWPHIPRTVVALTSDRTVLPLSGLSEGIEVADPVANFNELARSATVALNDTNVAEYLRFFVSCYIAPDDNQSLLTTRQAASAVASGASAPRGLGEGLPFRTTSNGFHGQLWHVGAFEITELAITVTHDGQVSLRRSLFARFRR